MNPRLVWFLYAALMGAGLLYYVAAAAERAYERMSLPQLFYVAYVLAAALIAGMGFHNLALAVLLYAVPAAIFAWVTLAPEPVGDALAAKQSRADLEAIRRALKEKPDDIIALDNLVELYRRLGLAEPALAHGARLLALYDRRPDFTKLRMQLSLKLDSLRVNGPGCADDPRWPAILRACPGCEAIVLRAKRACPTCGAAFYPSAFDCWAAQANQWLEAANMTRTIVFALLFVPLLYSCGAIAYGILLGVWTLAFTTTRDNRARAEDAPAKEFRRLAWRLAVVGATLLTFRGYSRPDLAAAARSAPAARAPSAGSAAQWRPCDAGERCTSKLSVP
jgi:hypothetical protein